MNRQELPVTRPVRDIKLTQPLNPRFQRLGFPPAIRPLAINPRGAIALGRKGDMNPVGRPDRPKVSGRVRREAGPQCPGKLEQPNI